MREYTPEQFQDILFRINQYIEETDLPILEEIAYQIPVPSTSVRNWVSNPNANADLGDGIPVSARDILKKGQDKATAAATRMGITAANKGQNPTMAIYLTKAIGQWTDKPVQEPTTIINVHQDKVESMQPIDIERNLNDSLSQANLSKNKRKTG